MCKGERGGGGARSVRRAYAYVSDSIRIRITEHTQESEAEAAHGLYVGPVESNIHMAKQVLLYK